MYLTIWYFTVFLCIQMESQAVFIFILLSGFIVLEVLLYSVFGHATRIYRYQGSRIGDDGYMYRDSQPITTNDIEHSLLGLQNDSATVTQYDVQSRGEILARRCDEMYGAEARLKPPSDSTHWSILFNDVTRVLFCAIPKVASSNIKRLFLVLGRVIDTTDISSISAIDINRNRRKIAGLGRLTHDDIMLRLQLFKKVIVVRNPLERLISAYNDKLKDIIGGMKMDMLKRLNLYKAVPNPRAYNLTFADFIRDLVFLHDHNLPFDQHWAKYTDLCDPCHVQYNYVAKYETLDKDMEFILNDIGVGDTIKFPKSDPNQGKIKTASLVGQYYRSVPSADIQRLKEIYREEMVLFNYSFPDVFGE